MLDYFVGHAMAQNITSDSFTDRFRIPSNTGTGLQNGGLSRLLDIIAVVMNWLLVGVAIVAFVYLVLQGIKYITSGGDAAKATEARNGIINAIIGIVVVVLAFFIINIATGIGGDIQRGTNP